MDRFLQGWPSQRDPSPLWSYFSKFHGFPSTHVDPYPAAANHEAANQYKPHLVGNTLYIHTTIPVGPKIKHIQILYTYHS